LYNLLTARNARIVFTLKKKYAIAIMLAVVLVTGVSGAILIRHTFPATPSGGSQIVTSTCTTLTLETTGMLTGFPEQMLFNCGPTSPAITGNAAGSATPTFTLPAGASSLSLVAHLDNGILCTGGSVLTSGTAHAFSAGDSLDYCLGSNSYPSNGIASFTVTWSQ
jgi:hypothetical protein